MKELILKIEGKEKRSPRGSYVRYELYKETFKSGAEYYTLYGIDAEDNKWYFGGAGHNDVAEKLLSQIIY